MAPPSECERELELRLRRQEVVAELGRQALGTDDVEEVFREAAIAVRDELDSDFGAVFELLPAGNEVVLDQGVGWRDGAVGDTTVPADTGSVVGHALESTDPVVVDDLETESRVSGSELLVDHGVVSGVSAVVGPSEEPWGVLGAYATDRREFADHDAEFVGDVADTLASAIEGERAHDEFEEMYGRISDAFFALDEEWRFTYLNERAHEVINPDGETLVGKNIWEAFPDAIGRKFKGQYEHAMYEQEAVVFEEYYPEPVDAWFEVRAYPSETGLSVYFRDVTERVERERELRETKDRLEIASAAGSVGTWTWDVKNDVVTADEYLAENYGIDPEVAAAGRPMAEFYDPIHEDDEEETWEQLELALEETGELDVEFRVRGPDGETRWFLARGEVTYDDDGDPVRMHGAISDITERTEHQRRLERYRQYTDDILNAVDDVFYVVDETGDLKRWNETVPEVTGYSNAEIESMSALEFFGEDADRIANAIAEGFENGSTLVEAAVRTRDGESIPYEFAAASLEDSEGNPVLAGIGRDITARKERERELAKYETIVETIDDGIYVTDDEGYFTMVNDAYAELTGYDREELIGAHASLVVDEDVIERSREARSAATDEAANQTMEATLQRADGDTVPTEGTFATLRSGDGERKRVGVVRDITERKEQRRQIEESERRYRTLVENFPNGSVALFDEDMRYTAVGGQLVDETGVDPDDRIGHSVYEAYPDEIVEEIEPYFHAALDGERNAFDIEYHDRHLSAHTLPIRNGDGEVFAGMLVVQDVTEQVERERRLEELVGRLEESNERLEQFAYAASHDLQEPLRMVSSYLQLIERRYADELDSDGEEFIEFAVDGADRMRNMIEGLLQYSRVETRGDPFEPIDLNAVFADVLDDLQVRIEETDAEITVTDLPRVEGDGGQLRQVFQNLLDNAIEYSGDGPPQIHVSAERTGDEWTISVRDEGIGIDPEDADRVFQVFQRLHPPDDHAGTGIGLALCERIVERHGGEIRVDSEPGEGATFSFTLPAVMDQSD